MSNVNQFPTLVYSEKGEQNIMDVLNILDFKLLNLSRDSLEPKKPNEHNYSK